jgi:hypothetical protein
MHTHPAALGLLTSLAVLAPSIAQAGVTGVTVSPSAPTVNQPAMVTVTGTNPCGAVEINFGDGEVTTFPLQTPGLPFTATHTWTTSGPKTVTAKGQGNCTGQVMASIQVKSSTNIAALCKQIDCSTVLTALKPAITATFGFATPGGTLALIGKNFGTNPGSVVATLTTWTGGETTRTLSVIEWKNTMVGVDWPSDIAGVKHHNAALRLTTANKWTSDPRIVTFFPHEDFKVLPWGDVKVVSCGTDGNVDACNGQQDPDDDGFSAGGADSFNGFHYNVWGAIGNDSGTDKFQVALKNDWVMQSLGWSVNVDAGEGAAAKPGGFSQVANWQPSVSWWVSPNDSVYYVGVVTITGPTGVPHK